MAALPSITVATVCFNAESCIEKTLQSVGEQSYAQVEHLIIDGASKDSTLDIIRAYAARQDRRSVVLVSEPDKGLYDAMNKALMRAKGDYIVFLNAGDCLYDSDTLAKVARTACEQASEAGELPAVVYGQTDIVDQDGNFLRHRRLQAPEHLSWRSFRHGMLVCHQSFYARTDLARQSPYNLSYRFSADVDWCIRIMRLAAERKLALANTHAVLCRYLAEGMSTRNHKASLKERFKVMRSHYGLFSTLIFHLWFLVRAVIKA